MHISYSDYFFLWYYFFFRKNLWKFCKLWIICIDVYYTIWTFDIKKHMEFLSRRHQPFIFVWHILTHNIRGFYSTHQKSLQQKQEHYKLYNFSHIFIEERYFLWINVILESLISNINKTESKSECLLLC